MDTTTLSNKIKERFCKDCGLAIKLFDEPYFSDRMNLYNRFFGCKVKWQQFLKELELYQNEQDYFTHYNEVKDAAINAIKESEEFQRFNTQDMNIYRVSNQGFPSHDIFKSQNVGRYFVSIDMVKANFTALSHWDSGIFNGCDTWEKFLEQITSNKHIIESKYIRQVILGNCNPKRQVTYEKYLMDGILTTLLEVLDPKKVVFFSNDEIVIDITTAEGICNYGLLALIETVMKTCSVKTRTTVFRLHQIVGTKGFLEEKFLDGEIEFKCLDSYAFPFVLRHMSGLPLVESDLIFKHEGQLARFITYPKIEISDVWKENKPALPEEEEE